ncbi:DUF6763 family protein [Microbulbifer hydrolyticus]|uniref:Uncharacterized protein n=1 Tax=Microbulbifer hydrolyticus TaxID=48074 RepID=A0A6P1TBD7_9GAMM|nr:DUF6763 family protein [Microbulbifer hydrolyticus]MBB5210570.1 hypothetical protein [Microbulbifer hydrolyticus]QHQ38963.1 hypothetical protein GTQ55_08180 [Microbulbifer hydrolyticus]
MARIAPEIGSWFENFDSGDLFEVVAVDHPGRTIEIQYLDGTLGEIDFQSWPRMPVIGAAEPEDANAGYGTLAEEMQDAEDGGYRSPILSPAQSAIDRLEGESFPGTDEGF